MSPISPQARRRRRIVGRAGPLLVVAVIAFVAGALVASGSPDLDAAKRFASAWQEQDFDAMYAELTPEAASEYPRKEFEQSYLRAQRTATVESITAGQARGPIDSEGEQVVPVGIEIVTDSFGTVRGELGVPVSGGAVAWRPSLVFPGLAAGEQLERKTKAPQRASILAKDRTPIAQGPADARTSAAPGVTGEVGEPTEEQAKRMARAGFPAGTPAGKSGLELAFDPLLAGTPGGTLYAAAEDGGGRRELAAADPKPSKPLRTTLDLDLQEAAATALGGLYGGIAVLDAESGEVRALAGVAFSAPQPPGSTFKIVTATAGLEAKVTEPGREYPVLMSTNAGGRVIQNAHKEACGGTLVQSFANSCNTVFAPLGVEVGGEKLVGTAEQFGFNSPPTLYNDEALAATDPPESSIPNPITDSVELAVSAIGQGEVLATPLQMASVAQTIANGGVRSPTSLVSDPNLQSPVGQVKVTTPKIAKQVGEMMVEVVRNGTARAGGLSSVQVAGKTGTAELGPKKDQPPPDPENPDAEPEQEVDAWFAAYAPAQKPKLAIGVMIIQADGDGGVVAAPIAAQVFGAAL